MSDSVDAAVKPLKKPKRVLDPKYVAYRGVWVFIEHDHGHIHPVSWELLGKGRELADKLNTELAAVILGGIGVEVRALCDESIFHGADLCYLVQDPVLGEFRNQPYSRAMTELVNLLNPEIFLLGATTQGRDLAGSVATSLLTGLTADCTGLDIDISDRSLLSSRPTFGGSLMCTIVNLNTRPQMATIRTRVMPMSTRDATRRGRVVEYLLGIREKDVVTKVIDFIPDTRADKPQLAYADFVVAGGRGLSNPKNFALLFDLAKVLGAEVGATRPAVHAGWVEAERQVGQSGNTVRPRLYIAAGISGAVQHRVGMEGADVVVAINNDARSAIMEFADYALIGNAIEILPALVDVLRTHITVVRARRAAKLSESDHG